MTDHSTGAFPGGESTSGTAAAVKEEAAQLQGTARHEAAALAGAAKDDAVAVAHEAKTQLKQVYGESQRELREQAATQQKRVAEGLRAIGEQLGAMAEAAPAPGIASDLVQQASARLSDTSQWLDDRDPGSVIGEVKRFARRKPGLFIGGALVAGILAGRLTRALADDAKDAGSPGTDGGGRGALGGAIVPDGGDAPDGTVADGPGSDGSGSDAVGVAPASPPTGEWGTGIRTPDAGRTAPAGESTPVYDASLADRERPAAPGDVDGLR